MGLTIVYFLAILTHALPGFNVFHLQRRAATLNFPYLIEKATYFDSTSNRTITSKIPQRSFKLIIFRINDTDTSICRKYLKRLKRDSRVLNSVFIEEGELSFYTDILRVDAKKS